MRHFLSALGATLLVATSQHVWAASVPITVVGVTDSHGRLANLPVLGGYLAAVRARHANVLVLDSGDAFQGTLESDINEGATVIDAYKKMDFTALTIGNHEFDYGPVGPRSTSTEADDRRGALKARVKQASPKLPVLAANILENGQPLKWPGIKRSLLVQRGGAKIGLIGVSTEATPRTTIAANFVGLEMKPAVAAIIEEATLLRKKGAALILVSAHAGGHCSKFENAKDATSCDTDTEIVRIAQSLPKGLVDAIFAGHTHQSMAHEIAGIAVVQAYAWGKGFSRIDFVVDTSTKRVTQRQIFPPHSMKEGEEYEGLSIVRAPAVERLIAPALAQAESKKRESLGVTLAEPLRRDYDGESALANFITSQMLALRPNADIAAFNGGGIRADLPAGELTYGTLYQTLPFDNRFAIVRVTGAQALAMFKRNLQSKGGVLAFAGARVVATCVSGGLELSAYLTKPGAPEVAVTPDMPLTIVTNDFVATGGDGVMTEKNVTLDEAGPTVRDAIAEHLRGGKTSVLPHDWFDKAHPRLALPGPRPLHCSAPGADAPTNESKPKESKPR